MTIMRRSATHIKINVLCILNLHSILIAKESSQSQLVPSVQHADRGPSLCAIKPELQKAGAGVRGARRPEARGTGKSKFTSAVKRQRRSVFNIFQRVLPFHVVSSSSSASATGAVPTSQLQLELLKRENRRYRYIRCSEWSILFLGLLCGHGKGRERGIQICTLNYKLKSLKVLKAFAETKAKSKHNKGIKIASEQTNKRKQGRGTDGRTETDPGRQGIRGACCFVSVLLICTWNTKDTFS